jgi:hypothetical protein
MLAAQTASETLNPYSVSTRLISAERLQLYHEERSVDGTVTNASPLITMGPLSESDTTSCIMNSDKNTESYSRGRFQGTILHSR